MSTFPPVEPHNELTEIFPDIFLLTGSVRMGVGMRIPRNMIVLRHDGALTLINSVRLDEAGEAALTALGEVKHVVKIGTHGMDDAWYVTKFNATMWALPGMSVAEDITAVERLSADNPLPIPWAKLFVFNDTTSPEAAFIADRAEGVLLSCDSVQHWPDLDGCSVVAKGAMLAMGFKKPANIGPPWRKMMTPKGGSLESDFRRLLDEPFDHIIGGHGKPMLGGGKAGLAATVASIFG